MRNQILIILMLTTVYIAYSSQILDKNNDRKELRLKENTEQLNQQDFTDIESLPNLFAVLIGINRYKDEKINGLKCAVTDVKGIHAILNNRKRIPYKKSYIHLLTDESTKKPTRLNIYKSLNLVCRTAKTNDTILFYFSGHGFQQEGESYILSSDTDISVLTHSAVPLNDIHQILSKSEAKKQVIILDACHSGARRDKGIGILSKEFVRNLKHVMASAQGRVVLSSSDVSEASYEFRDKGYGIYTYYLIEALKGKGDADNDGLVTIQEAYNYVYDNVTSWAHQKGVSQNPRIDANSSGRIVLTVNINIENASFITQQYQPETVIADFDGAEMVRIPAGKFTMGSKPTIGNLDEHPQHEVYLDEFYIDMHEVTNAQFAMFLKATGYPNKPKYWNDERFNSPEQPLVGVSWYDANEYAKWVGRRLPTEAEWEKSARGVDRRIYPWGNEWNEGLVYPTNAPVSVESENLDESPYGIRGMAGNVAEWVADYYKKDYYLYNTDSEWINPSGPELADFLKIKVIRGASWKNIDSDSARCAIRNRNMSNMKFDSVGFRLAK